MFDVDEHNVGRAQEAFAALGVRGALLGNPATITWLTGYAPPIISGPNPFEGGPAVAWIDPERVILLVSDAEQGSAATTGAEVITYGSYQIESPLQPIKLQTDALLGLLRQIGASQRIAQVGIESMPSHLYRAAALHFDHQVLDIDGWADTLRAVKTRGEIEKIRAACGLCSAAQAALREAATQGCLAGQSEIALWNLITLTMEQKAGERLPVLADLVAGGRTAAIGGPPTSYVVQPGDPVLADIVPRLNGYWGDICNVYFAGGPSDALRQVYAVSREALYAAIDALRPGVFASEIDHIARGVIARHGYPAYPHHTGHGLGVTWHEEPRICDYNALPLQAGMVIALEPGVYLEGVGGVRLEHVALVTESGAEILTQHSMAL